MKNIIISLFILIYIYFFNNINNFITIINIKWKQDSNIKNNNLFNYKIIFQPQLIVIFHPDAVNETLFLFVKFITEKKLINNKSQMKVIFF